MEGDVIATKTPVDAVIAEILTAFAGLTLTDNAIMFRPLNLSFARHPSYESLMSGANDDDASYEAHEQIRETAR